MPSTISPNMGLILPSIGIQPGPTYGQDQNNSMTIIDAHDHTPGNGVQLTPASLNINADVNFMGNNAVELRSARFDPQPGPLSDPTDLGCLYENGVDLYYNDGNGNQIRLTQSGSIAGTSGSITGLVSPASASYVSGSKTFVFQQDVNKAANMDIASLIIRKTTTSSPGITISAPSSLSSNYTLTLPPSPPLSIQVLVMDTSGNITTSAQADSLTVNGPIVSNTGGISALNGGNLTADGQVISTLDIVGFADMSIAGMANVDSLAVGATAATSGNINTTGDINTNVVNCSILNASTHIYPSGGSNAQLVSPQANSVEINNGGSSRPIITGVSLNPPIMVVAAVDSAGNITSGGGFSVSHPATGQYVLTYSAGIFDGVVTPAVVVTPLNGSVIVQVQVFSQSTTGCDIRTLLTSGGPSALNSGFNVMIVGQRA